MTRPRNLYRVVSGNHASRPSSNPPATTPRRRTQKRYIKTKIPCDLHDLLTAFAAVTGATIEKVIADALGRDRERLTGILKTFHEHSLDK